MKRSVEDPADFGMTRCSPSDLAGADADHNAAEIVKVFEGVLGPHRDSLVLGTSLALRVTGVDVDSPIAAAEAAIDDGRAKSLLASLLTVNV